MARILVAVLLIVALTGCGTVTEQVYLQGLDAAGNVPSPPIFITDSVTAGQFQISPRIVGLATGGGVMAGTIPVSGPHFPDSIYRYPSRNLSWSMSRVAGGLDLQVAVSRSVALTGGIAAGQTNGSSLMDWSLGIGLFGAEPGKDVAVRFDGGVHGQTTHIVARSVAVIYSDPLFGPSTETVRYFIDEIEKTNIDFFAALTFNSRVRDWPVNIFLQGGFNRCSLASFEPKHVVYPLFIGELEYTDTRTDYNISVWSVAPGLYVSLSPMMRVLAGARWVLTDMDNASTSSFWMPFVQLDFVAR